MEDNGMVAVVRGLKDSSLAVSLLDTAAGKEYTLAPNSVLQPEVLNDGRYSYVQRRLSPPVQRSAAVDTYPNRFDTSLRDSGAQACDGRYASVYKTTHCKMMPTSPPYELTEFPPQRRNIRQGHDNFVVGGTGSGDTTYRPVRARETFRGGMCWTDRGSVCAPRPSRQPDSFADSLRKYPAVSPDRSEIIERLITYTQSRNYARSRHQTTSPTRHLSFVDEDTDKKSPRRRPYEPDVRARPRSDESPTKGPKREDMEYQRPVFCRNYDVRHLKEMSRKIRDNIKYMSSYTPYNQPTCPIIRERYEPGVEQRNSRSPARNSHSNMVNSEMQATTPTVCRNVSTTSRMNSSKKNVAIPLSPSSSEERQTVEGAVSEPQSNKTVKFYLNYFKTTKHIEFTSSAIDLRPSRNRKNIRTSKSEDVTMKNLHTDKQILEWLEDIFKSNKAAMKDDVILNFDSKYKIFKRQEKVKRTGKDSKHNTTVCKYCGDISEYYKRPVFDSIKYFTSRYSTKVYRAEVGPLKFQDNTQKSIVKDWLDEVPLRPHDYSGRTVERDHIFKFIMNRLRDVTSSRLEVDRRVLKSEIVDILQELPLEIPPGINNRLYLNRLAYSLMEKLHHVTYQKCVTQRRKWIINVTDESKPNFTRYIQPTEGELKLFLKDILVQFYSKYRIEVSGRRIKDTATELTEILLDSLEAINNGREEQVVEEILPVLKVFGRFFHHQAANLANHIINRLRDYIYTEESHSSTNKYEMLYEHTQQESVNERVVTDTVNENYDSDMELYLSQLSEEINEWLYSLQKELPQARNYNFRQLVARDLATDIVDRQKYLRINSVSGSEEEELENLRYHIFKWIHKLSDGNNLTALHYAPELMRKIRSIPAPALSHLNYLQYYNDTISDVPGPSTSIDYSSCPDKMSIDTMTEDCESHSDPVRNTYAAPLRGRFSDQGQFSLGSVDVRPVQTPVAGPSGSGGVGPNNLDPYAGSNRQPTGSNLLTPGPVSVEEMNDEYDNFLKSWLQDIPIPVTNPDEAALAEKMRMGVYNGIWRAVAKIKSQPLTLSNPFYYEDVLDDEIEELFSMLPQTQELMDKKHLLKVRLIEKTSNLNEQIKIFHAPEVFKQQLVDNVSVYIPRLTTPEEGDPVKVYEELQALLLADNYILFTNYRETDRVKANVYMNKLLRKTREFVEELKRKHDKELKDIDIDLYAHDVVNALQQVPLPSDETIKEEADKILLGLEIEQWYSDLPISQNDDITEQLKRKRLRDALARKIHEMEKSMDLNDSDGEQALRNEVSKFLNIIPLGRDESLNINFMVTELANRMKNRPKDPKDRRKSVVLQESINYADFSRNMPGASSMHEGTQRLYTTIHDLVEAAELPLCCKIKPNDPAIPLCCVPQNVSLGPEHESRLTREKWLTMEEPRGDMIRNLPSTSADRRTGSPVRPAYQQPEGEVYDQRPVQMTGRPPGTPSHSYQREGAAQPGTPQQVFDTSQGRRNIEPAANYGQIANLPPQAIPQPQWQTDNFGPAPTYSPAPSQPSRRTSIHEFRGYDTFQQQPPATSSPIRYQTGDPYQSMSPSQTVGPPTVGTPISERRPTLQSPSIRQQSPEPEWLSMDETRAPTLFRNLLPPPDPNTYSSPVRTLPQDSGVRSIHPYEGRPTLQSPSIRQQSPEPEWLSMDETRAPTLFRNLLPPPDPNAHSSPVRTLPQDSGVRSIHSYSERTYVEETIGPGSETGPRMDGTFGAGPVQPGQLPGQILGPGSQMADSFGAEQSRAGPGMSPGQYPGAGPGSDQVAGPLGSPRQFETRPPQGAGVGGGPGMDTGTLGPFVGGQYRPSQSLGPQGPGIGGPQRDQYRPSQSLGPRRDPAIGGPAPEQNWPAAGQVGSQGQRFKSGEDALQGPYGAGQPYAGPSMAPYEVMGTNPSPSQVGGQIPGATSQGPYQSIPGQSRPDQGLAPHDVTGTRPSSCPRQGLEPRWSVHGVGHGVLPGPSSQPRPSQGTGTGTSVSPNQVVSQRPGGPTQGPYQTILDQPGPDQSSAPYEMLGVKPSPSPSQVQGGRRPSSPYQSIPIQETSRPDQGVVDSRFGGRPGIEQRRPSQGQALGPGADTLQGPYGAGQSQPRQSLLPDQGTRPSPSPSQIVGGRKPSVSPQGPYQNVMETKPRAGEGIQGPAGQVPNQSMPIQGTFGPDQRGVDSRMGPPGTEQRWPGQLPGTDALRDPYGSGQPRPSIKPGPSQISGGQTQTSPQDPYQDPSRGTSIPDRQGMGGYTNQGMGGSGTPGQDRLRQGTGPNVTGVGGVGGRAVSSDRNQGVGGPCTGPCSNQGGPCQRGGKGVVGPSSGAMPPKKVCTPYGGLQPIRVCGQGTGLSGTCQSQGIGICQGLSQRMGSLAAAQRSGAGQGICVDSCVGPQPRPVCAETCQQAPQFYKSTDRDGILTFRDQLRYSRGKINCACNQTPCQFFPKPSCYGSKTTRETQTQKRNCYESETESNKCQCQDKSRCRKSRTVCYSKQDFQMGCPQAQYFSRYPRYC